MAGAPLSILIAALGGEGGGVLAEWIVAAARSQGFAVQSSSIPGVAQRTGATTYYVELHAGPERPLMTLAPSPGQVDIVLASELLEAGRAMLNGFVTPERTTLIASTHRVYTVAEKMQMADGRFDVDRIITAAGALARERVFLDMQRLAAEAGSVINAVLFGALAGSGALPLSREACERAIRAAGKGTEPSLAGFARGFEAAAAARPAAALQPFPPEAAAMVALGLKRVTEFQDSAYGDFYLKRLESLQSFEPRLVRETARFLALWMSYEDVIRVADLKSRRSRLDRVRSEVRAKAHEPVHIVEYFRPRVEEFAAILPRGISARVARWGKTSALARKFNPGLYIKTTSVAGLLMLRSLAALKPLRRLSGRFADENALIERWLSAIRRAAPANPGLAFEIALCGRLVKGYGDTQERGRGNFLRILDNLVEPGATAEAVREAREAALGDAEGRKLDEALAAHGVPPRPLAAKPIAFIRRPTEQRKAA